jgi:hypothetical protein
VNSKVKEYSSLKPPNRGKSFEKTFLVAVWLNFMVSDALPSQAAIHTLEAQCVDKRAELVLCNVNA